MIMIMIINLISNMLPGMLADRRRQIMWCGFSCNTFPIYFSFSRTIHILHMSLAYALKRCHMLDAKEGNFIAIKAYGRVQKLDGVGPVDNRPSTDKLHHFVQFFLFFLFFYLFIFFLEKM